MIHLTQKQYDRIRSKANQLDDAIEALQAFSDVMHWCNATPSRLGEDADSKLQEAVFQARKIINQFGLEG